MKKIITPLFIACALISCNKDDDNTVTVSTGTIRYTNTSSNRYEVFLDGSSLGLLNGKSFTEKKDVTAGSHVVKATQFEGYIVYPTTKNATLNVTKGGDVEFAFP